MKLHIAELQYVTEPPLLPELYGFAAIIAVLVALTIAITVVGRLARPDTVARRHDNAVRRQLRRSLAEDAAQAARQARP